MTATEPKWLIEARSCIGMKEVPGPKTNAKLLIWLKKLHAWWTDDEQPWCGTFVAHCFQTAEVELPKEWYRALAWRFWGEPLKEAIPGALLVFVRQGGGHVGFYVGEDASRYFVLGGNQRDQVCIIPIEKRRCASIRWPKGQSGSGRAVQMTSKEASSVNEA